MIITISGTAGSGKSTVAKIIAKKLKYKFYSTGDLRGKLAQEKGLTIDQLNSLDEEWTHTKIDEKTKKIGQTEDNIVFDSWLAWHFIPKAVKIFLKVDSQIAAERIFKDQRPDEQKQDSVEKTKEMIEQRIKTWSKQVKKYYDVDFLNEENYDLVIDTTNLSVDEIVKKIVDFVQVSV